MFGPIEVEGQRFRLKPMNCPGHILIYKSRLRSYRELPLRFSEFGTVYRFERSGVLHGLDARPRLHARRRASLLHSRSAAMRVRADARGSAAFDATPLASTISPYVLSSRAAAERGDTDAIAEDAIRQALERYELPFEIDEGGGAFYGPKLDINVRDAIGRPWQLGTVQVDFVLPARFGLKISRRRRPRPPARL